MTVTCHPQWHEIKNALLPEHSSTGPRDVAARVLLIRLRALMAFLIAEKVFGEVKADVRVIQF